MPAEQGWLAEGSVVYWATACSGTVTKGGRECLIHPSLALKRFFELASWRRKEEEKSLEGWSDSAALSYCKPRVANTSPLWA